MDILVKLVDSVPNWIWITCLIIVFGLVTGERILWKFEALFPMKAGSGRGKIKLLYGKKKGARIRYNLELDEKVQGRKLDFFVNAKLIHSIPADKTCAAKLFKTEKIELDEPQEGDKVEIFSEKDKLFESKLFSD